MEAAGQKLTEELAALNAALDQLTHDSDRSGARRDRLRPAVTALSARHTEAQVAKPLVETARARALRTGRPDDITAAVLRLENGG